MVHLCKLQLRGIRSYNPNTLNTIEFYSPLTLIVGVNGSGKTTIIETLKYITCNELPQNTRGGAFIYDPKLLGTHEVKANIKLSFVNIDNKEMTIQRSLQGIQKKTGLTQKSLETNLSVIDNDQIINVSNKLSAVDVQMEHFLGVSNALLQNIIFCHQEESNWFLSEPVNVKKKFDDIFNTTKYSKALDNIKSVRRELGSKVKMKMQELEYLMERKMKKEKVKVTSYGQKQKMEMIGFELDKLRSMNYENEIVKIRNEIDKEKGNENEYNRLQLEIEMMERIRSESISKDEFLENVVSIKKIEDCHKNIFMGADLSFLGLNDSTIEYNIDWATMYANDSDFKTKLGLFEKHFLDYNKSVDFYHNRSVEIRDKLRNLEQKQKDTMKSYDKIDKCKNEILIAKNEICKILQTTEYDNSIDHAALLNDNEDLHSLKESILCLENELQSESKEIIMLECEIKENKNMKRNNEQELHELEKSLESYKKQLQIITQGNDSILDIDENEHDLVIEKESLCMKIAKLEESYYIAIKNNEKNYEQKHLKQQKEICKAKMCDLIQDIRISINALQECAKSNQKLHMLLSNIVDSITFCDNECECESVIEMWHDTKKAFFDIINTEIAEFEERKIIRDDLITKMSDIQNNADLQSIKDICDPQFNCASSEDYANKIEEKSNTLSMSQNAIVLFDNFQKKGLQRNMCYLCHRKFTSDEKDAYRSNISNILSNLKIKANTCKIEHDQYMQYKNDFENRRMINAKVEDIRILIEKFYGDQDANKYKELKIEDFILQIKSEDCDDLYEAQNKLHTIELKITRLHDCINEYRNFEPICDFEYIDIEDIKIDITKTKGKLEAVENKIVRIRRNLDYKLSIQNKDNISNEIEKLNKCIDKARMQDRKFLDEIAHANKRVKAVTEKIGAKNQDLQRFRQELGKARLSIDEKIRKINNSTYIIDQNEAWISQEMSLIYKLDASCKENTNDQQCLDSIKSSIESDVTKTRKEYNECNANLQNVKSELEMAQKELTKYEKCLETIEKFMLNIDNCEKLEELRQKLQGIDYKYIDGLKNDLQKLEKLNSENNNRIFMLIGEQKQIGIQYKRIETELSNDYCDAEDKYAECYIEVKTLEYIIEDVEKCIKALDKSIVEFYSTKIDEINSILKDLWVNTYKGNDIDYIMLKSETNDNKVYNYRMVMCKNGIELDLRGRSSAGQKMLISILTRLAICDAFCSTFNVLALDEPTTNLDRENIESLAYMLQKIIDSRKLSNFQLIIITHDESFLETMNRNGCNEYYRVYKDTFGNSMITKENLYQ